MCSRFSLRRRCAALCPAGVRSPVELEGALDVKRGDQVGEEAPEDAHVPGEGEGFSVEEEEEEEEDAPGRGGECP